MSIILILLKMEFPVVTIIEDDVSVREAIEVLLQAVGMESQSFGSAEQYLSDFIPGNQDIMVLDLNLPGMSGLDLIKKISLDGLNMQVIVTTAFDDQDSRELCKQYGVIAFLRKPVDGVALIDLLSFNFPMSSLNKNQTHNIEHS